MQYQQAQIKNLIKPRQILCMYVCLVDIINNVAAFLHSLATLGMRLDAESRV